MIWPFRKPDVTVLMVCTANVCRSTAAEALLRHHLQQRGMGRSIAVRSAGTDVGAPGRRPDPRVVSILEEMGVKASGIRARQITEKILSQVDHILVMERNHLDAINERFPDAQERIRLLDAQGGDIPDPYFGNKAGVRVAVEHIDRLTREFAETLPEG